MKCDGKQTGLWRPHSFVLLGIMLFLMISVRVFAQPMPRGYYPGRTLGTDTEGLNYDNPYADPNAPQQPAAAQDTTKRKARKPLESYFFNDSIRAQPNFMWHANLSYNRVTIEAIDTTLNNLNLDYPYLKKEVGDAILGPLGAGTIPLNYFRRPQYNYFSFASAFDTYFYTPENAPFYNVKKPFTHLNYYMSGQKKNYEEQFYILHAQNISPSTGFNFSYKSRGMKGDYAWQGSRAKNLSANFSHTGKKYTVHAGYIFNSENLQENGGVVDSRAVTDTLFEISQNIPVKMQNDIRARVDGPRNILKNNTFYAIQSYGIPLRRLTDADFSIADRSSVFFGHSIVYSRFSKTYTDLRARTQYQNPWSEDPEATRDYYANWWVDSGGSRDSIFESFLSNRFFVQIQPWDRDGAVGTINAGVGMDNRLFYSLADTVVSNKQQMLHTITHQEADYYAYGSVEGKIKKYIDWQASMTYYPTGSRSQDLDFGGALRVNVFFKGEPASLSGKFRLTRQTPDYWTQHYFSNHYLWSNSFSKENETRFDITLNMPQFDFEAGAYQSVITNKIYYDAESLPQQEGDVVSVTGAYLRKDFRWSGLHLNNRVLLQWSTNHEVIPVPLAALHLSWFYELDVVKEVLRLQAGLNGRYNTHYYAFGYNPAITRFYNQREKEIGGYPMIDLFVNAKWKRMRILLELQHASQGMLGTRNYFDILNYPLNQRVLKLGFSWAFYD